MGDGLVFFCYKHGKEVWGTAAQLSELRAKIARQASERRKVSSSKQFDRIYRRGDPSPNGDGKVFMGYHPGGKEWWTTPEHLAEARAASREQSKKTNRRPARKAWRKQWAQKPETKARLELQKQDPEWMKQERAKKNADQKRRRAQSPSFRAAHNIRVRIRSALVARGINKSETTEALIGCSIDAFRLHIEANFKPGMTWENRTAWHIDHKLPLSMFDLTRPEQQKIAFHYNNCVPEWKHINLKKNDKVEGELFLGRHYRTIVPFRKTA